MLAIKQVGSVAIREIIEARPFTSYEEFVDSVPKAKVNKKVKRALFDAGALDSFGARDQWVLREDEMIDDSTMMSEGEKADAEKSVLGYAVSRSSEIDKYKKIIEERIDLADELEELETGDEAVIGGEVVAIKEHKDKKGNTMAFIDLSFGSNDYSSTWFSDQYQKSQHYLAEGAAILVMGDWDAERKTITVTDSCSAAQLAIDLKKEKK